MERFRVKVHRKGIIVLPAEVRRRLGITEGSYLELLEDDEGFRALKPKSLLDAFGIDGPKALEVVKLIEASRRREVEEEASP